MPTSNYFRAMYFMIRSPVEGQLSGVGPEIGIPLSSPEGFSLAIGTTPQPDLGSPIAFLKNNDLT
jgi:hypothetical protein